MNFPILSSLILLPTIGALFLFFTKDKDENNLTAKYVSLFRADSLRLEITPTRF